MSDETTNETPADEPTATPTTALPAQRPDLTGEAETVRVVLAEVGASAPAMDTETLAVQIVNALHDSQHASDA